MIITYDVGVISEIDITLDPVTIFDMIVTFNMANTHNIITFFEAEITYNTV